MPVLKCVQDLFWSDMVTHADMEMSWRKKFVYLQFPGNRRHAVSHRVTWEIQGISQVILWWFLWEIWWFLWEKQDETEKTGLGLTRMKHINRLASPTCLIPSTRVVRMGGEYLGIWEPCWASDKGRGRGLGLWRLVYFWRACSWASAYFARI